MKQKILFLTPGLNVGGAETFFVNLVNSLKDEFEITIVSLSIQNPLIERINKDVEIVLLGRAHKFDIKPILQLRKLIHTKNINSIFCIGFFTYFIVTLALLFKNNLYKKFLSYHTTVHRTAKDSFLNKFFALFFSKNDLLICVSEQQAIYTSDLLGISMDSIAFIHNGVDVNHWNIPDDSSIRNQIRDIYSIPESASVIVMTAAFRPEKNHLGAIESLCKINAKRKEPVYLLLVGGGKLESAVKDNVIELQIPDYVKFTGVQNDVRPFYWASDLFTLTSNRVETFSIAALEAMSCGLPCVLTDVGGAREMIDESSNGFVCDTDSESISTAWEKALNENYSTKNIREQIVNRFSHGKMVEKYIKILQNSSR